LLGLGLGWGFALGLGFALLCVLLWAGLRFRIGWWFINYLFNHPFILYRLCLGFKLCFVLGLYDKA